MSILQNLYSNSSLFNIISYEPDKQGDYVVIVPNLSGLASITLKLIMYRLNNIDGRAVIYITDKKSVTQKDIDSGIYTDEDFGKFRVDVFIQKVAVNFELDTCDVIKKKDFLTINFKNKNVIYLDFVEGTTDNKEEFKDILRNKAFNRFTTNNMYIKVDTNKGKDTVYMDCYSRQTYLSENVEQKVNTNSQVNKSVREAIMSRIVSGLVNIMVTPSFNLTKNVFSVDDKNMVVSESLKEV